MYLIEAILRDLNKECRVHITPDVSQPYQVAPKGCDPNQKKKNPANKSHVTTVPATPSKVH